MYLARFASVTLCAAALLLGRVSSPALGETLVRLHMTILTLALDRPRMMLHGTVHLTLHSHVTETIAQLDNVTLPDLDAFDVLGDERRLTPGPTGTDYNEVLTLTPKRAGTFVLGPASIDAVNTLTGQPSRFSSNTVTLKVARDAAQPAPSAGWETETSPDNSFVPFLAGSLGVLGVLTIAFAAYVWWRRRMAPKPVLPQSFAMSPPIVPVSAGTMSEPVRRYSAAVAGLRREPTLSNAQALRAALRDALNAAPQETLSDLIARQPDGERSIFARALRAAERAAFIEHTNRSAAIDEGMDLFEAARQRLETGS